MVHSGIGQAIAVRLASEKYAVVIDYRGHGEGAEKQTQILAKNPQARSKMVQGDVTKIATRTT